MWIKIHRGLLEWEWYDDPNMVRLWLHLLLKANYEDRKWHGEIIPRGSLLTSRATLVEETGLSQQQIRTCLERLKSTSEVVLKVTSKYTLVTICNYDKYQIAENEINQQITSKITSDQPANNHNIRSKEEKKEVISISKDISITKKESPAPAKKEYAQRVHLTDKEHDTLVSKYGEEATSWMIDKLSAYKVSRNKSYSSDYAAINNWVVDRWNEQKAKDARGTRMFTNSSVTEYHDGII